jgi:hypothetical protein
MTAGGADIWGGADAFAYAYTMISGDFDCQLRVLAITSAVDGYARVGLMVRESLDQPGGRQLMVAKDAINLFQVVMRVENNWGAVSLPDDSLRPAYGSNSWVRLQRTGTIFQAYAGSNGVDWLPLYKTTGGLRVLADPVYVGIAASSHSSNQVAVFTLSDFGPTPTVTVNRAVTRALLDYRRGDGAGALEWCNRVLAYPASDAVHACLAQIILALAEQQCGQPAAARLQLAAARDLMGVKSADEMEPGHATEGFWFEWVFARVLLQEATAKIEKTGP